MSDFSDRYRRLARPFTQRVEQVPATAWGNPAPPEGWVARDIIRHLVEWMPAFFFDRYGIAPPDFPPVDTDPVGAWKTLDATVMAAFADPEIALRVEDTPMGPMSFERMFDQIGTGDIFLHTWDLARAAGLDETLDPDEVHRMLVEIEPMDEALRSSGHYGPRVEVPAGADEQTRLIAFIGRRP